MTKITISCGLFVIASTLVLVLSKKHHNHKDGKLILNPYELVDLILNEEIKTHLKDEKQDTLQIHENCDEIGTTTSNMDSTDKVRRFKMIENKEGEKCQDTKSLEGRKVWSRWSKWGECSTTCGQGVITRHRLCVGSRCAPGEREEQHQTCTRVPCLKPAIEKPIEDMQDMD